MSKRKSPPNKLLIRDLIRIGRKKYEDGETKSLTRGNDAADELLCDLQRMPHAFVLGCLMDRQIKAEKAWLIPHEIRKSLGSFSMRKLKNCSVKKLRAIFKEKKLHRYNDKMSRIFHGGVQKIAAEYGGDASRIWRGKPSSAAVVYRFLQFDGVGQKISSMAANILVRRFRVPMADYSSLDISVDVHVMRVMARMGLVPNKSKPDIIIWKARDMHPQLPGVIDYTIWEIGTTYCRRNDPLCDICCVRKHCPKLKI